MTTGIQYVAMAMPGVSAETVRALAERRFEVERGCDPAAYESLAMDYAQAGMIAAANRLLDRARHYAQECGDASQ